MVQLNRHVITYSSMIHQWFHQLNDVIYCSALQTFFIATHFARQIFSQPLGTKIKISLIKISFYFSPFSANKIMHPIDWKDQQINIKHFSNIQFANF